MLTRRSLLSCAALGAATPSWGQQTPTLSYPRRAGPRDTMNGYAARLLALALARCGRPYRLQEGKETMTQSRALIEMRRPDPPIDVYWTVTTPQREQALLPVRIPIERGLIGWRVALVRARDRERWRELRRLAELQAYTAGQKHDWPDTEILRANGLPVQTSAQYESLFQMLALGRFDYFPRSVLEIATEQRLHAGLGLEIEPYLALQYPSAMYFFVSPARPQLADDLARGLEAAQADGSFERLFQAHFGATMGELHLRQRRVLNLHNPSLPAGMPLERRDWWMKPVD